MLSNPADLLGDPARLAAVNETRLLGSPPEEAFDRLTRLASATLGAPVSLLSVVDGQRQWLKSVTGDPPPFGGMREIPLDNTICPQVIACQGPVLIGDLMAGTPEMAAAAAAQGMRAYAGMPLITPAGQAIGVLCVAHPEPREWDADAVIVLRDLAALAVAEIEWRRSLEERARTEESLRAAEGMFRAMVEQSVAAFYIIQDGFFRYVNRRFCEVFGRDPGYFDSPRPILEFVVPEDRQMVADNIRRRLAGEVLAQRYRLRCLRADGGIIHVEVHGSMLELDGRPALVGVGIDITDHVLAERERESALAARDRFYAMISHELRTPVSAVMLYNDLLLSGVYESLSEQQRDAVEHAQLSAAQLLELINELLDLAKLDAGKLEMRVEDVEVCELVESVATSLAPLALEHGCDLSVGIASRPLTVTGDARRIRQILLNLLSNAMKFGRGAPVEIRCGEVDAGVQVDVRDHGPGIPDADLARIFDDFVQLGDPVVGTGLGLPIARRLAELQGGRLEVRSHGGDGCTFSLFLPSAVPLSAEPVLPFTAEAAPAT